MNIHIDSPLGDGKLAGELWTLHQSVQASCNASKVEAVKRKLLTL